jgi:hypothetical protein
VLAASPIMFIYLVSLRPVHRIADVMRDLKKESSTWAKDNFSRRLNGKKATPPFQ